MNSISPEVIRSAAFQIKFWAKVAIAGPDDCWEWLGAGQRYGHIRVAGSLRRAHRVSYSMADPIPDGLELDHLCRNTKCVNPSHLEAVTHRVNSLRGESVPARNARKTHCARGHSLGPDGDVRVSKSGARYCRPCRNLWARNARKTTAHRPQLREYLETCVSDTERPTI